MEDAGIVGTRRGRFGRVFGGIIHSLYRSSKGGHEDSDEDEKDEATDGVDGDGGAHAKDGGEGPDFDIAHLSAADGHALSAKDAAMEASWAAGEEDAALHSGEAGLEDTDNDEDDEGEQEPGGEGEGEEEGCDADASSEEDSAADTDAASKQPDQEGATDEPDTVSGGEKAHEARAYVEVFFGNDGDEEVVLEHDVHHHAGGEGPGDGRGGIGVL